MEVEAIQQTFLSDPDQTIQKDLDVGSTQYTRAQSDESTYVRAPESRAS